MAEIITFPGETTADEPPEEVLEKAKAWGMAECVVIGFNSDGRLMFGGSIGDMGRILLLLEGARLNVLNRIES